jgi:hypothetical protein
LTNTGCTIAGLPIVGWIKIVQAYAVGTNVTQTKVGWINIGGTIVVWTIVVWTNTG